MPHATTITRSSIATKLAADGQAILPVVSGAARFEKVPAGGVVVTDHGPGYPLGFDPARNLILYETADQQTLYAKAPPLGDLTAAPGTLVVDVSDVAHDMELEGWVGITDCRVMADGSWLLVISRLGAYTDGVKEQCRIYRSTNAGATWTNVHHQHDGGNPTPGAPGVLGNVFVYGDYTGNGVVWAGRKLWYSEDAGLTWDAIWSKTTEAVGSHYHRVVFPHAFIGADGKPTRIYSVYGDGADSTIMQHDRPVGWEPGDGAWDRIVLCTGAVPVQPESVEVWDDKLLIAGHDLWSFDPATLVWQRLWRPPLPSEADADHRYALGGNFNEWIRMIRTYEGVWYVSFCLYAAAADSQNGVYASSDAVHWTALWRDTANDLGLRATNFVAGGRVYGYRNNAAGVDQIVSFPAMKPALVNALRVEAGEANVITDAKNSDFVGWVVANENFYMNAGTSVSVREKATSGGLHGGECLHLVGVGTYCDFYLPRYYWFCSSTGDTDYYEVPAAGKKVVVEAWVKVITCPSNWTWELQIQGGADSVGVAWDDAAPQYIGTGKWTRLRRTGRVTGPPTKIKTISVRGLGAAGAVEAYVDAVRVLYLDDWKDGTAWQIGGTARVNEQASIALGHAAPWSLLFDWRPESGWAAYTSAGGVPLVTIHGPDGTGSLAVVYYPAGQNFGLWNGSDAPTVTGTVKWRHFDTLRFAVSQAAGGALTLRVFDPVGGIQSVTDDLGVLSVGTPIDAHFGVDPAGTGFGIGLFHSLGVRRGEVSAAEFAAIVERPGWSWDRPLTEQTLTGVDS